MGRNNKWIESQPTDTVHQVAHRALERRLERVWHYLERAVCEPASETENVHQLRVSSRRTAAALEIFHGCLPRRRSGWMEKQVKRVRRAAGEARDFDVLLQRWREIAENTAASLAVALAEQIEQCRDRAQEPVEAVYTKLRDKRFEHRVRKLLQRAQDAGKRDGARESFGTMARSALAHLVSPYLEAAEAPMTSPEALHAFRIQGKQVRYAMEIFAGAFEVSFRDDLYPIVENLQERLGAINDRVSAIAHFEAWHVETKSKEIRQALELGIDQERQALETLRQEFLAWWTSERRQELRCRFAAYVNLPGSESCGQGQPGRST